MLKKSSLKQYNVDYSHSNYNLNQSIQFNEHYRLEHYNLIIYWKQNKNYINVSLQSCK